MGYAGIHIFTIVDAKQFISRNFKFPPLPILFSRTYQRIYIITLDAPFQILKLKRKFKS